MLFGLTEECISKINSVFERYSIIDTVVIYGSRAKGTYRLGSDIDLTLKGEGLTSDMVTLISSDIDELNTPYLFDISIYDRLDGTSLKEHIDRVGQIFYQKLKT